MSELPDREIARDGDYTWHDVQCNFCALAGVDPNALSSMRFPEPAYRVRGEAYWLREEVCGWMGTYFGGQRAAKASLTAARQGALRSFDEWHASIDWLQYLDGTRPVPKFEPPE